MDADVPCSFYCSCGMECMAPLPPPYHPGVASRMSKPSQSIIQVQARVQGQAYVNNTRSWS